MIKSNKRISYNNKGSAIITALVVTTVLMVLCLSLLAIAYSFFLSQKNNSSDMSDREMLYSSVEMLESGLDDAEYIPGGSGTGSETTTEGSVTPAPEDNIAKFWEYLLQNIADNSWQASVEDENKKYFELKSIGSARIIVEMYWKSPGGDGVDKAGSVLYASYNLYDSGLNLKVKAEKTYVLECPNNVIDIYPVEGAEYEGGFTITIYNGGVPVIIHIPKAVHGPYDLEYVDDGTDKGYYLFHKNDQIVKIDQFKDPDEYRYYTSSDPTGHEGDFFFLPNGKPRNKININKDIVLYEISTAGGEGSGGGGGGGTGGTGATSAVKYKLKRRIDI